MCCGDVLWTVDDVVVDFVTEESVDTYEKGTPVVDGDATFRCCRW